MARNPRADCVPCALYVPKPRKGLPVVDLHAFNPSGRYTCPQWRGVALYFSGWVPPETCPDCDGSGGWLVSPDGDMFNRDSEWRECSRCGGIGEVNDSAGWVYVTMVGDDARHLVEISELTPIAEDDYCGVCGQIGCTHDGRER